MVCVFFLIYYFSLLNKNFKFCKNLVRKNIDFCYFLEKKVNKEYEMNRFTLNIQNIELF